MLWKESFFGPLETNGGRVFPTWVDFQNGEVGTLQTKPPEFSCFNSEGFFLCFVSQPLRKFPADAIVARFEGFLGGKSPGHLKMKDTVGVSLVVMSSQGRVSHPNLYCILYNNSPPITASVVGKFPRLVQQ